MSAALRIAIDASRTTVSAVTGTEYYATQVIRQLIKLNKRRSEPHHITLYFRDDPPDDLFTQSDHVTHAVIPFKRMWTHLRFAREIWHTRPDVTFVPAHTLPFALPGQTVVTVHDLGYLHFPNAHEPLQRQYLDLTTRYSAWRANCVLADSQATADDLQHFYGTSDDKIRVIYPGVDAPPVTGTAHVRTKYQLPLRYFLFMGTLQPRKNIARIVRAFDRWQHANADEHIALVLAGKSGWLFSESWVKGVQNVYRPGYIDEADKGALLAGATALLFPSLYEGFGFPALEAMHCGTPVIASNTSSLPEIVGEAGLQVDPLDVNAIATAMDLIVWNKDLRSRLRVQGYQQARQFTWERCGEQILTALEETAAQ